MQTSNIGGHGRRRGDNLNRYTSVLTNTFRPSAWWKWDEYSTLQLHYCDYCSIQYSMGGDGPIGQSIQLPGANHPNFYSQHIYRASVIASKNLLLYLIWILASLKYIMIYIQFYIVTSLQGLARYRVHKTATWDRFLNIIKKAWNHSDGVFWSSLYSYGSNQAGG